MILQTLRWIVLLAQIVVAGPILYLSIVSIAAIIGRTWRKRDERSRTPAPAQDERRFAIIVPAHDEELGLSRTLDSLARIDYPRDHFDIHVIADNCNDATARVARATGHAQVHERFDAARRGKGYALNWMFQRLEDAGLLYDAYVIVDADSIVTPNLLRVMAGELTRGARAVQVKYAVLNADDSPAAALRWIAFTLMNDVRQYGRFVLGGSSSLLGNGMCFSHKLMLAHPWQAFALSEDYQHYLTLVQAGERIHFAPDAIVNTVMPTTFGQMRSQDIRWESDIPGESAWVVAFRLLRQGIRTRSIMPVDAAAELLTPPLSMVVAGGALALAGAALAQSPGEIIAGLALLAGLLCYIGAAFILGRPPRATYAALLHAPGFVAWKLWVVLVLKRRRKHATTWVRTSRSQTQP